MNILNDLKVPNLKIPKFKFKETIDLKDLEKELSNNKDKKDKKDNTKLYDIKYYETIREMFHDISDTYKDNIAILEKFDEKGKYQNIKYSRLREDVESLGNAMLSYLNLKDKKVLIIGETTYQWYVTYMALLCSGIIAVPIDKELPINEIENLIKRSKASVVVYSNKKKSQIEKIKNKVEDVEYFVEMYDKKELLNKEIGFEALIKIGKQLNKNKDNEYNKVKINKDDFKLLIFTSGTTAAAKGVMISNYNLANNLSASTATVQITDKDRFFSVLPLHHTYESTIGFLVPISRGASIAVCQGLKYIVKNMQETSPTIMLAVPVLVESLYRKINLNIKKSKKENLVNSMMHITNMLKKVNFDIKRKVFAEIHNTLGGKLRLIVSAAAPIDPKIGKWVENIGILFLQGYGLTETSPISAITPDYNAKVGSVGKPVICGEIKIDNPNEKGEGEVLIKSKTLMLGYYEDETLTNEVIKDKWFSSGDIGYMDKEGFLYLTGRSKNVIITSNGKNIYPEELELLVNIIPLVKESMVYGVGKDENLKLAVRVTLNEEYIEQEYKERPSNKEIYEIIWKAIKDLNRTVTTYKAIKKLEIKKEDFVKTTTMKIKRKDELEQNKSK